jgi:hypothetical protein
MTIDHKEIFRKLKEAHQILDEPQFIVSDVCEITGATPKAIEHFVDPKRGLVHLVGDWVNPGTGKRRRFTGDQVLMIAAAYAVSRIGFPQRWSVQISDIVARRATGRINGLATNTEMTLLTYPLKNGDWAFEAIYRETDKEPTLPLAVMALDVDRLIDETLTQLLAIVNNEAIPDFSFPDPEIEPSPYSPKSNFFRSWEKSPSGRWVYVGLTEEETDEMLEIKGCEIQGDDLVIVGEGRRGGQRFLDLTDKHERVRLALVAELVGSE